MHTEHENITHHSERYEELKSKVYHSKWHLKKRKSVASKVWNCIYEQLVECFDRDSFSDNTKNRKIGDTPLFEVIFFGKKRVTVITNKRFSRAFKGVVIDKEEDTEQVVKDINEALSHYNLRLREPSKPESQFTSNRCISEKHYLVDFVDE